MGEVEEAKALFQQVQEAFRGTDERKLWFAWKRAYRLRFWKPFGAMGPGQVCAQFKVPYDELLKRITAYEMAPKRNSQLDEAELAATGTPPSSRA
jgi:hypothetical protein